MDKKKISLKVNGNKYDVVVNVGDSLLETLRYKLKLTGTKKGCSVGECGACTVIIDNVTIDSCLYLSIWADGKEITTIESLEKNGEMSIIQEVYLKHGAIQCGFCSPGFILQTKNILENKHITSRESIRKYLAGNLCRCTGYEKIVDAVEELMDDYEFNIIRGEDGCYCKTVKTTREI